MLRTLLAALLAVLLPLGPVALAAQYDETLDIFFRTVEDAEDPNDSVGLNFGGTLRKFLYYDRAIELFHFTAGVYIEGDLTVTGLVNGYDLASLGGGSDNVTVVYKTANETVSNSTTLQDDDHLTFTAEANESYAFEVYLFGRGNTSADFRFAIDGQTGATCSWGIVEMETATSGVGTDCDASPTALTGIPANNASTYEPYVGWGIYHNGSTQGSVTLQWAQSTLNANNVELLQNSYMKIRKLN